MEIPAGKHKIEFKFEPKTYKTGGTLALIGSLMLFGSIIAGFYFANKKNELAIF
jgi:uncharacterized membrane protein YfhO